MNYVLTNSKGNGRFFITLNLLLFLIFGQISIGNAQSTGSALQFDGTNDYVVVNNPFTAFQKEITVEWWVYIVPGNTYELGSGIGQGTVGIDNMSNNVWLMHFNGNGSSMQFYVNDAGTWRTHSPVFIPSGWHHIAGVADANGTRLFIDGLPAGTSGAGISTGIWSNPNAKVHFGKDVRFNAGRFMTGTMDEIRIWSRAICQGELQNNKFCEIPGAAPNLEGNYHFNQGIAAGSNSTETTLLDASGNGRHGTLVNMGLSGSTSNWVTPGGIVNGSVCAPFVYPSASINAGGSTTFCMGESVTLSANTNASFTYQWKRNGTNIPGATNATYAATTSGNYTVQITNLGCSAISNAISVTVYTADADGDGVADVCDLDDDNDGILDATECNKSNFFWSNAPTYSGTTATGTINGITYTYSSTSQIEVTGSVYAHNVFPSSYNVPNVNPTIKNTQVTSNTLTFTSPMTNPVLVFASIGNGTTSVPISFSTPVQIMWSQNVVQNSATQITGTEGYAIVRLNGTYSSISFDYLKAENWCNFAFGADFTSCGDTDGDGTPDFADLDSDNDGCSDAVEGSLGFLLTQTTNNKLNGAVSAQGVPLLAGAGQGNGASQSSSANCFCQPNIDRTLPVVKTKNATITLGPSGSLVNILPALINNGSTDACGISSLTLSKSTFNCSNLGANTVTLTVTDVNGNVASGTAIVTVVDNTAPTITCGANISVVATSASGSVVNYAMPTFGDNCSATISLESGLASGSTFPIGTTIVTYKAVDASGNSKTCSFNVTVTGIAPAIVSPGNISLNTSNGLCSGVATYTATETTGIPASTITYSIAPGSTFNVGTTQVTATATNAVGTSSVTFNVTVVDNIAPTITCAGNIDVFATSASGAVVNYVMPTYGDNCSATISLTAGLASGSTFPIGTTTVTYNVVDPSGNSASCSFDVTVTGIPPVIVSPGNITVNTSNGLCSGIANYTATETTGIPASTITYSIAPGATFNVGTTQVTATATNAVGTSSVTFDVSVVDAEAPNAIAQNLNINLDANGNASITAADVNNGSNDACGVASVSIDKTSFNCTNVGENTVTLTVTDVNGNSSSTTATVTVNDVTAPNAIAQNITINLDANGNASISAADVNNGSNDACGVASVSIDKTSFNCTNVGANTVTLTVTDVNGNSSSTTATVTVNDVTAPNAIAQNVTVNLANGTASVSAAQINNGSNDACGIASLTLDKYNFDCSNIGANSVVLTVTDVNGNVSTANATVNVQGFISTCSITATANNTGTVIGSTFTGAATNQMYIGYGAQSMKVVCTAVTGGPFTYKWYGTGLSNTNIANPIFTPTAGGNYTLMCEVTNSSGCVTYCEIEICVFDVRAAGSTAKNPKVYLCHVPPGNSNNPQTLNISINAVPAHLGNHAGDRLGSCNMVCGADMNASAEGDIYTFENATEEIDLVVYPNPSASKFTFVLESASSEEVMINIFDIAGRKVLEINNKMANEKIELGEDLIAGSYLAEVVQGSNRKTIKIIKIN